MLTFKQLILETDFSKVWQKFLIHYPQKNDRENKFAPFYEVLKRSDPLPNKTNMYIYINVFEDDEKGDPESFIAHCLWEMTFYFGFDDSKAYE